MFNLKTLVLIATFSALGFLSACKGQDVLHPQSNPVKNYDSVLLQSRPYSKDEILRTQEQLASGVQKPCAVPFVLNIDGEEGKTANFREEEEKTLTLHVHSLLENNVKWDVRAVQSPCENCVRVVSTSEKETILNFTWTPSKGSSADPSAPLLQLRYDWPIEVRCASLPITENIDLVVKPKDDAPTVKLVNWKTEVLKFTDSFQFQIQVLGSLSVPQLTYLPPQDHKDTLSADKAVDCKMPGTSTLMSDGTKNYVFDCSFNSNLVALTDAQLKQLNAKGQAVDALFVVQAKFKGSQGSSEKTTGRVHLQFDKITAKTSSTKAAPGQKTQGS